MAPWVKNPPARLEPQETQVRSLGREAPLEESMATHSSILAWRIQWTEEPGGLQSIGSQELDTAEHTIYINRSHYLWVVILGHSFSYFSLSVIFHIIYI